ncbi:MAG TPA: hypothetical protein VGG23_04950 [Acidimicrobiales bacterium]|jgi:hypothetical protein
MSNFYLVISLLKERTVPTYDHVITVARSVRRDLDRGNRAFTSVSRMELTERLRRASGEPSTRMKAVLAADLEAALGDQGLRCYPRLTATTTGDSVRVFRAGSAVGDLIDAVLVPSAEHDRDLAAVLAGGLESAEGGRVDRTDGLSVPELLRRVLPRQRQVEYVQSIDDADLATT